MSALLRQVTFNAAAFASATSTPVAASGTVRFRRAASFVSGGQWVEPGHYDAAYAAGAFTAAVWLAVPDDADEAARYTAKINGTAYPFSLSQGAAADLATLITTDTVEDVSAVSQLLATKEDALGTPAANGYVLSSTEEGVRSWVEMSSGGGAPSGPAGGVLSGTYPDPGFAADMATQAELDAHTANTSNPHSVTAAQVGAPTTAALAAHTGDLANPHQVTAAQVGALTQAQADALYASMASLAAYAQLAVANTFTKAQTVRGEATAELTRVLEILASDLTSLLKVKVPNGYGSATVEVNGANRTNQPALAITNAGAGLGILSVGIAGGGGYSEFASGGVTKVYTNRNTYEVVQGTAFAGSASSPAHERSADTSWIARVIDRVNAPVGQTSPVADWQVNSITKAKILPTGDIELIDPTAGVILKDRTTGTRYRLKVDGGVLGLEAA